MHGGKTFPKRERLRHGHEFRAVYERGRKTPGKLAVLYVLEEPGPSNISVGVVTSRAIGNAVPKRQLEGTRRLAW